MVYRYNWLAGLGSLLFAFYGLTRLLRFTVEGPPWQFVVLAGLALGVSITWTALSYRINLWLVGGLNLIAMVVAVGRIAAPDTTTALLPTTATFAELNFQLERAFDTIRNGSVPVVPRSGIVVILMVLFWVVGGLLAWGLTTGHPYVALLPPLVLSLQFATMDRQSTGWLRVAVFIVLVGGTILAVTTDERDQTAGGMARRGEWPSTRSRLAPATTALLAVTLVAAASMVTVLQNRVPQSGVLDWRHSGGLGGGYTGSSGSFSPFITIQQRLVNNSDDPMFLARITGDVSAGQVYFRLLTMETYNGGQFFADDVRVDSLEERPWEVTDLAFAGDSKTVTTEIVIDGLRMDWLPAAYTPIDVFNAERSFERYLRVRALDGSLLLDDGNGSFRGMRYSVESAIPQPDLNVLALTPEGVLSASFAKALDEGEEVPETVSLDVLTQLTRDRPPDAERYLDLPTEPEARIDDIGVLAVKQTKNLETDFERALALEAWFHSGAFTYTTDIEPGQGATDTADWLLDSDSNNYRKGYCENFALAMAVMARTLDIPSRVVLGFTPGERTGQESEVVVRARNSHAWVELWMPAQGWVRFDPTPRSLGDTPQTFETVANELGYSFTAFLEIPDPVVSPFEGRSPLPIFAEDFEFERFVGGSGGELDGTGGGFSRLEWLRMALPVLFGLAIVVGAIPAVKWIGRRRRMRRLREGDVTAAWEEIVTRLTDLKESPIPTMTPDEYAAEIDVAMAPLATIYGRMLYGPPDSIEDHHVATATTALAITKDRLVTRHSPGQRLAALYRPGTILPRWMRRHNGRESR